MKLGYCYYRENDKNFSLTVDEDVVRFLMKKYQDIISSFVENGRFGETLELFEQWKKLNDLLEDAKGEKENE